MTEPPDRSARPLPVTMERVIMLLFAWSLPVSLFGMQAGMILGAAAILGWGIAVRFAGLSRSPLDLPFLLMLIAVGLSLLFSPLPPSSFRLATSFWVWAAFFVVFHALHREQTLRLAMGGVLILSALVAAFGIYQSFTGHYPGGELFHPQAEALLRPAFGDPDRFCAAGLFTSRVTFAHMLLFPGCWLLAFALERFRWPMRLILIAGLILVWAALTCTWARSAPPALALASLGLVWTRIHPGKVRWITAGVLVALAAVALIWLAPGLWKKTEKAFSGAKDWGRLTIWQTALDLASEQPATGYGYGNFYDAAKPKIDARVEAMGVKRFAGVLTWAHNDLLTFLAECGILGAFALCWMYFAFFRAGRQTLGKLPKDRIWLRAFIRGSLAGVGAFLVTCMFHDNFFHGELTFMLFFAMGSTLAVSRMIGSEDRG